MHSSKYEPVVKFFVVEMRGAEIVRVVTQKLPRRKGHVF